MKWLHNVGAKIKLDLKNVKKIKNKKKKRKKRMCTLWKIPKINSNLHDLRTDEPHYPSFPDQSFVARMAGIMRHGICMYCMATGYM